MATLQEEMPTLGNEMIDRPAGLLPFSPCFKDSVAYSYWSDMDFTASVRFPGHSTNAKQQANSQ
jgi:muramidase (phage lysozyme)